MVYVPVVKQLKTAGRTVPAKEAIWIITGVMVVTFRGNTRIKIAAGIGLIYSTADMVVRMMYAYQHPANLTITENVIMMMSGGMIHATGERRSMITVILGVLMIIALIIIVILGGYAQTATTKHTGILTAPWVPEYTADMVVMMVTAIQKENAVLISPSLIMWSM